MIDLAMMMYGLHRRDVFSWLLWRLSRSFRVLYWSVKRAVHPGYRPLVFAMDMKALFDRLEAHNWWAALAVEPRASDDEIDRANAEYQEFEELARGSKVQAALVNAFCRHALSGDPFTNEFDFMPKPVLRETWPAGVVGQQFVRLTFCRMTIEVIGRSLIRV